MNHLNQSKRKILARSAGLPMFSHSHSCQHFFYGNVFLLEKKIPLRLRLRLSSVEFVFFGSLVDSPLACAGIFNLGASDCLCESLNTVNFERIVKSGPIQLCRSRSAIVQLPLLYYTILYYTILYYTILYYTVLYYTILYYASIC